MTTFYKIQYNHKKNINRQKNKTINTFKARLFCLPVSGIANPYLHFRDKCVCHQRSTSLYAERQHPLNVRNSHFEPGDDFHVLTAVIEIKIFENLSTFSDREQYT